MLWALVLALSQSCNFFHNDFDALHVSYICYLCQIHVTCFLEQKERDPQLHLSANQETKEKNYTK